MSVSQEPPLKLPAINVDRYEEPMEAEPVSDDERPSNKKTRRKKKVGSSPHIWRQLLSKSEADPLNGYHGEGMRVSEFE